MFDLADLKTAVAAHDRVVRVVIAGFKGSSPREVGAAMLVWGTDQSWGQSGTVGGGALEWEATARAQTMLRQPGPVSPALAQEALGPKLAQCCGGVVTLLWEIYDAAAVAALSNDVIARPVTEAGQAQPLAVARLLAAARGEGRLPAPGLHHGWMVEPVARPSRDIWIWGAGHVGRAVVRVLAPLPDLALTWVDVATDRFPTDIPAGVTVLPGAEPALLAAHAPPEAEHLILTYSHALDLALCHALLHRGFRRCGLIGSKTKWARFRHRLASLGHDAQAIATIDCPIGDPSLGKHPQAIAIGVAVNLLRQKHNASQQENAV
ncbi:xanthine dehydrogenase accessory protein XdhC [Pseudorhodobacter sp.]|uniref:xanthine dehydrogenase accessory protein XdhC n=1 Tax=Pseudorhodobacter sp. TaxID=1934400 RepID=UPI0026490F76|nr:xanthine dehydrogenase accessory protein XdhC [Pseudorhodobacter sp.]MDN5787884.1 xanthine dehydrogenase accessory protein XdhC [Pseudorhodobacter sp.]